MRQHARQQTARLSIDLPVEQHAYLKMIAAQRGLSMKDYILTALVHEEERAPEEEDISPQSFKKGLAKLRKEKHQLARNLSKQ